VAPSAGVCTRPRRTDDAAFAAMEEDASEERWKDSALPIWEEEEDGLLGSSSPPLLTAFPISAIAIADASDATEVRDSQDHKDVLAMPTMLTRSFLLVVLGTTIFGMMTCWNTLLANYEWMQNWRYTWPCVGLLFLYEGYASLAVEFDLPMMRNNSDEYADGIITSSFATDAISLRHDSLGNTSSVWSRAIVMLAGASLALGGAADAFLPVYVTGPNFLTNAGLAPDAAAFLACHQALVLARRVVPSVEEEDEREDFVVWAAQAVLLSQLLVLGFGSFDEVVTHIVEFV